MDPAKLAKPGNEAWTDDPCDELQCLQDMFGNWHVRLEYYPGVRLGFAGVNAVMPAIMQYFKESSYA